MCIFRNELKKIWHQLISSLNQSPTTIQKEHNSETKVLYLLLDLNYILCKTSRGKSSILISMKWRNFWNEIEKNKFNSVEIYMAMRFYFKLFFFCWLQQMWDKSSFNNFWTKFYVYFQNDRGNLCVRHGDKCLCCWGSCYSMAIVLYAQACMHCFAYWWPGDL